MNTKKLFLRVRALHAGPAAAASPLGGAPNANCGVISATDKIGGCSYGALEVLEKVRSFARWSGAAESRGEL